MIITITQENFNEVVEKSLKPVIIDVYAVWCGPCHHMLPIYEEVAEELGSRYVFTKLNVDESQELAIKFSISSVPTFIFIKDNNVLEIETGTLTKEALIDTILRLFE